MTQTILWLLVGAHLFGGALMRAGAADRVLLSGGRCDYEVVCAAGANAATALAARELRTWFEAATGVKIPQVTEPTAGRKHVFVGPNPWSAKAGVTTEGLKPEGYRLKTAGDDVHVVGMDVQRGSLEPKRVSSTQTGSLSGVFDLLERCLGIQFLWHDRLGTIIPKCERVTVPDLDIETSPAWTYRFLAYSPEGMCGQEMFARRLRLGHSHTVTHSHAWHQILPVEKYGQEHPEWFAEIEGKRRTSYYLERHGGQVCTTNPEVVAVFAQAANDYFHAHPERDMFSVSPNDGSGFCTCTKCRQLDNGTRADGRPILTDRLISFYNAIAEQVVKVHPSKLLGAYAYSYYREPPEKVKPHPNLYLVHATNTAYHQGVGWREEHEMEKQWRASAKHLAKYDIYYSPDSSLNLIAPVTGHIVEKIRAESEIGIEGGYLYIGQSYEQLGAGHVLLARLMWDPHTDAEALVDSYYKSLYGPAATHVQAYYDLLERQLIKAKREQLDTKKEAIRLALRKRPGLGSPAYILAAYEPVLDEAARHMKQAQECDLRPDERARLQRLSDQHELLMLTIRGMYVAARLEGDASAGSADAKELLNLIEQRQAVRERLKVYAPSLCANLDLGDRAETDALAPDGAMAHFARSLVGPRHETAVRLLPRGDFEEGTTDTLAKDYNRSGTGGATAQFETASPRAGSRSLRVLVPEGGMGSVRFNAGVKPGSSYRIMLDHWNDPAPVPPAGTDEADAVTRGEVPMAPRVRIMIRDRNGETVARNLWSGLGAHEHIKQWHRFPLLFQTPADAKTISFTVFLQHPGTYLLDEIRIEELGEVK
jgi:hypothetical protein